MPAAGSDVSLVSPYKLPGVAIATSFVTSKFSFGTSVLEGLSFVDDACAASTPSGMVLSVSPRTPVSVKRYLLTTTVTDLDLSF